MPYGKGSKRAGTKSGGGPRKTPYKFMPVATHALFGGSKRRQSANMGFGLFGASGVIANQLQAKRARRSKQQVHNLKSQYDNDSTPRSGGGGLHTAARAVGQSMFGGFRKLSRGKYEK